VLTKYEEKRLEYNLCLNELKKFKNDFENNRLELTKKKFDLLIKEKEKQIDQLKQDMDNFFLENKDEIVVTMLKKNLNIEPEYEFYCEKIFDDSNKIFVNKKTTNDVESEFNLLKNKIQKKYENKVITSIIYNDLNKCLNIYQKMILDKLANLPDKKFLDKDVAKTRKDTKVKGKKVLDKNWFFMKIMLPIIVLYILCLLFIIFTGTECQMFSSSFLSNFLCSFTVVSDLVLIFLTPILLIYLIVKAIKFLCNLRK